MTTPNEKLQEIVSALLPSRVPIRVLEAGCGSTSHLRLDSSWELWGIDISQRQLANNPQLHQKILGNLETYQWDEARFDLIVCWDVLEHLAAPEKALLNLFAALAPDGLLVLAFPHLHSIKGWVTKLTPYWVHVAFYRYVIGDRRPRSELDQFPTHFRWVVQPASIAAMARGYGLDVGYSRCYQGPVLSYMRQRHRWADIIFTVIGLMGRCLTFGRFNPNDTDCMMVLRKAGPSVHHPEPGVGICRT